jgi:hypothetical protein
MKDTQFEVNAAKEVEYWDANELYARSVNIFHSIIIITSSNFHFGNSFFVLAELSQFRKT